MKRLGKWGMMAALAAGVGASSVWAETFYYTGGGTDPNQWNDPNNWTNAAGSPGYPWGTGPEADAAIIPDGFGPSFNAGSVPTHLQRLQTGNMLVTFPSSLNMTFNSSAHGPVHASWLNQIEIFFSVVQRKVLTPNDFPSLQILEQRLLAFQSHYESIAKPSSGDSRATISMPSYRNSVPL